MWGSFLETNSVRVCLPESINRRSDNSRSIAVDLSSRSAKLDLDSEDKKRQGSHESS